MNFAHDLTHCSRLASEEKCTLAFRTFDFDGCLWALFSIIEMTENHVGFRKNILGVVKLVEMAQKHRICIFLSQAELGKR